MARATTGASASLDAPALLHHECIQSIRHRPRGAESLAEPRNDGQRINDEAVEVSLKQDRRLPTQSGRRRRYATSTRSADAT